MKKIFSLLIVFICLLAISCNDDKQPEDIEITDSLDFEAEIVPDTIPNIYWYASKNGSMVKNMSAMPDDFEVETLLNVINSHYSKSGDTLLSISNIFDDEILLNVEFNALPDKSLGENMERIYGSVVYLLTENDYINKVTFVSENEELAGEYTRDDFQIEVN
ncbi:MAG: hypothetical protein Kapaf2KO_05210 [Candidatus Kapaibacteriales bacterium]